MPKRESAFERATCKDLERRFPGCVIIKLDSGYMQGIPDRLILWANKWAILEFKAKPPTSPDDFEPNQEWYIEKFNGMSFAACIYPENAEEVLGALERSFTARGEARVPQR